MHGHHLLIKYIRQNNNNTNKTIIEIGSTREYVEAQNSTEAFIKLCIEYNMKLISVDMDPLCSQNVVDIAKKYNFSNYEVHTMKGEKFLELYDKKIDYIYLDAFDYDHGRHSIKRKQAYKNNMNCEITNELSHKMHLECCKNICNKMNTGGYICFDDILDRESTRGKGVLAIPYIKEQKFRLLEYQPCCMIFTTPS